MKNYLHRITLLYIEDNASIQEEYAQTLKPLVKHLYTAKDGVEGLYVYQKHHPDIILCDLRLSKMTGLELAKAIRAIDENQPIVFTTEQDKSDLMHKALLLHVEGYFLKPLEMTSLTCKLQTIAKHIINERENTKNRLLLEKLMHYHSAISVITDFNTIECASRSFFKLFEVNDSQEFFQKFKNFFDIFLINKNHLYGNDKQNFLFAYENLPADKRIISIMTPQETMTFYIHIETMSEEPHPLYLITLMNIQELQEKKLLAHYKETHDSLTNVYNRTKFDELFKVEFQRDYRYKRPLCIALLDIDHFTDINTKHGHFLGDEILKQLATYCQNFIRQTDVIARWDGAKFILLLSETPLSSATKVCETLRHNIALSILKNVPKFTISIGLTELKEGDTQEEIIKRAEEILDFAKFNGYNQCIAN